MTTQIPDPELIHRVTLSGIALAFILSLTIEGCTRDNEIPENNIWLDRYTYDIPSADISTDDIDFSTIDNAIGNATIVGLGEATHGTTEFFIGTFWSWDECEGHEYVFRLFDAPAPTTKYYVHNFNKSEKQNFFMDFNSIDLQDEKAGWLRNENKIHVYGGTYCPSLDTGYYYAQKIRITDYFDGVFFFKNTYPTTILPTSDY